MNDKIPFLDLRVDRAPAKTIHNNMLKNLDYNAPEIIILMCAIAIASIGLNLGSTAVVIGAMLISPVMGPIQTLAYSLAIGDKSLVQKSMFRLLSMIITAFLVSTIYFFISPLNAASGEIIARTNPTFWDLLIAIFGGFAGIIGVTRSEKTNVVPGVAIATALMPPLCTAGFGIAHMDFSIFIGALYLFTINAFFIMITAYIGFYLMGMSRNEALKDIVNVGSKRKLQVILALITIPCLIAGFNIVRQEVINSSIANFVQTEIDTESRKVVSTEIDYDNKYVTLIVVGDSISKKQQEQGKELLVDYNLDEYTFKIVQSSFTNSVSSIISGNKDSEDEDKTEDEETESDDKQD